MRQQDYDDSQSCADWGGSHRQTDRAQTDRIQSERANGSGLGSRSAAERKRQLLERIVETKIIPRLLVANLPATFEAAVAQPYANVGLASKVGEFSELIVDRNADAAISFFVALRDAGATLEALFQDLLAPTALRLGVLWEEDINDFVDVTRGFSHLQQIVHQFGDDFRVEGRLPIASRRALLMPIPGETHTFGISLVGQFFLRDGWRVWGGPPNSADEIIELVTGQWFDMIGLSASILDDPRSLAATIRKIRSASCNADVAILVGGNVFNQFPKLVGEVGGDATATDGKQALTLLKTKLGIARSHA